MAKKSSPYPNAQKLRSPHKANAEARADDEDVEALAVPEVAAKHRGTRTYRLTEPHYRLGIMYQPGELVTITDEPPGKSWKLVHVDEEGPYVPSELANPYDAAKAPKQLDESGKEITGQSISRAEVASQGREVPGVHSDNAVAENDKKLAQEALHPVAVKPSYKK